ncbi:excinuclease ABC subunit UvrA [Candidatus Haliotispira prima]|uniref:UvrABC system protein A n=1 Tax=Candidatus Haliotispira prima TaxID=3034016 RepID=A0ABY8MF30_9SPIO|nr:excinuclease ABC subunit UvrA [Candidatus Haliotispira prima]
MKTLRVQGAREHNLKDISVEFPRGGLVVISGLSGSGKSSLAFDTIYAEGQRRYVESLSAYARQFLGLMEKPDVDYIEGLSPAIAIEQKTTHRNPRSTVGTVTEIYDYLRLLYARVGQPYCPTCNIPIEEQSVDQILETVLHLPEDSRLLVLAPMLKNRKTEGQKLFEDARRSGFSRMRINGEEHLLEEDIRLDKRYKYNIEIVVDRIRLTAESRRRLSDAVETALELSGGKVQLSISAGSGPAQNEEKDAEPQAQELFFSEHNSCSECGYSLPELEPRLFSFNSPIGACDHCSGLGRLFEFDFELLCPDPEATLKESLLQLHRIDSSRWYRSLFGALSEAWGFSTKDSWSSLSKNVQDKLLYGSDEQISFRYRRMHGGTSTQKLKFPGIFADLQQRYKDADSERMRTWFEEYMRQTNCPSCKGQRLKQGALSVYLHSGPALPRKSIIDLCSAPISEARAFVSELALSPARQQIASQILKEVQARLGFLESVGLNYLSLERSAATLSGGEAQRIRLATQIGSQLTGVLYILDEPSIGLHQRDNQKLIDTLLHLKSLDNTVIVVEHDEQTLRVSDYIVDMGPGAGVHGGFVVAQGPPAKIMRVKESLTGQFLSGKLLIPVPKPEQRRTGNGSFLELRGASEHNLKNVDIQISLGTMTLITGVSGSGKSTLLEDVLYPAVFNALKQGKKRQVGKFHSLSGCEKLKKVIRIDQSPIGRTSRSNPATYVGAWTPIRELFAALPDARARGYATGRFSFNVKGGRCEACEGGGTQRIEMHFLPDVHVTCDVCNGKRFNGETLEVRYKGKNIHDVLEMTIEDGVEFFSAIPQVKAKLDTLSEVGLAYMTLGQSAVTLSGGEAQRVKLASELSKRGGNNTLYIIDEPTTGLHFADVKKLLEVLQNLVEKGSTICMIEHNLDVIKQADYIIDMGPEGGAEGGMIVAKGTPEQLAQEQTSYTGQFLKEILHDAG